VPAVAGRLFSFGIGTGHWLTLKHRHVFHHIPKQVRIESCIFKELFMIKSLNLIDLFDDAAIEKLRAEARRGQPVAVLLPMSSSNPRQDADLILDAVHQGASNNKPRALGTICQRVAGSGRLDYYPEFFNASKHPSDVSPAKDRPIEGFNANDFFPTK
jgi:hypothetical protein